MSSRKHRVVRPEQGLHMRLWATSAPLANVLTLRRAARRQKLQRLYRLHNNVYQSMRVYMNGQLMLLDSEGDFMETMSNIPSLEINHEPDHDSIDYTQLNEEPSWLNPIQ